jgi:hypothetical protein
MPRRLHHPHLSSTNAQSGGNKILKLAGPQLRGVQLVVIPLPHNPNEKDKNGEGNGNDRKEPPL